MKTITTPNGKPYISIIDKDKLFAIKLHEYDDVMVMLDKKVIPQLIEELSKLVIEDEILYNEEYDSYYNARTGEWTEPKCSDPNCEYCKDRPPRLEVASEARENSSNE